MTLGEARKEAARRWSTVAWRLAVDQTTTKYVYEVRYEVRVPTIFGSVVRELVFKGDTWQAAFDAMD
jgi:hypothetical protein